MEEQNDKIRLDKWLWAARFYKTRSIARKMIEGGKVDYNGVRAKPSREVELGAVVRLLQGNLRREVEITGISDVRGPAKAAQKLYRETEASLKYREEELLRRQAAPRPDTRPNKKERRELLVLKHQNAEPSGYSDY